MSAIILRAALDAMTHMSDEDYFDSDEMAADIRRLAREALARADRETEIPVQPTEAMITAAQAWSTKKYGHPIATQVAIGCWQAMLAAFTGPQ